MKEQAGKRADGRSRLDTGQTIEPVEKAFNKLANRTEKNGKRDVRRQGIIFCFFQGVSSVKAQFFIKNCAQSTPM